MISSDSSNDCLHFGPCAVPAFHNWQQQVSAICSARQDRNKRLLVLAHAANKLFIFFVFVEIIRGLADLIK
jgi:hypothetical protein